LEPIEDVLALDWHRVVDVEKGAQALGALRSLRSLSAARVR
jgi:hypothetical protein